MTALIYLGGLVGALVVFAAYLDSRWKSYQVACPACVRREHLDALVAEGEAELLAAFESAPRDLSPVAPVLPFQRKAGDQS